MLDQGCGVYSSYTGDAVGLHMGLRLMVEGQAVGRLVDWVEDIRENMWSVFRNALLSHHDYFPGPQR